MISQGQQSKGLKGLGRKLSEKDALREARNKLVEQPSYETLVNKERAVPGFKNLNDKISYKGMMEPSERGHADDPFYQHAFKNPIREWRVRKGIKPDKYVDLPGYDWGKEIREANKIGTLHRLK